MQLASGSVLVFFSGEIAVIMKYNNSISYNGNITVGLGGSGFVGEINNIQLYNTLATTRYVFLFINLLALFPFFPPGKLMILILLLVHFKY